MSVLPGPFLTCCERTTRGSRGRVELIHRLVRPSNLNSRDENNEIEFQKAVKLHSIVVDDGASRAHRDFAEGKYQGGDEMIPPAFGDVEGALRRVAGSLLNGVPCPMAHYMEWRRTGRGEAIR